jgi:hypothetical protein
LCPSPCIPVEDVCLALGDPDGRRRYAIREQDGVKAFPSGAWDEKGVETEEIGGISDRLCGAVFAVAIPLHVDAELFQNSLIIQTERVPDRDIDPVHIGAKFGGKHRLSIQQGEDLCDCAVALKASVENVKRAVAPAASRCVALDRIPAFPADPPHGACKSLSRESIDSVQKGKIAGTARLGTHLGVGPGIERFDHRQHFLGLPRVDQVDCAPAA